MRTNYYGKSNLDFVISYFGEEYGTKEFNEDLVFNFMDDMTPAQIKKFWNEVASDFYYADNGNSESIISYIFDYDGTDNEGNDIDFDGLLENTDYLKQLYKGAMSEIQEEAYYDKEFMPEYIDCAEKMFCMINYFITMWNEYKLFFEYVNENPDAIYKAYFRPYYGQLFRINQYVQYEDNNKIYKIQILLPFCYWDRNHKIHVIKKDDKDKKIIREEEEINKEETKTYNDIDDYFDDLEYRPAMC